MARPIGSRNNDPKFYGYNGNKSLKPVGYNLQITKVQQQEYLKCAVDFYYFLETYVKILTLDKGYQAFKPRAYQKRMIDAIDTNRYSIIVAPRQCGKSETVAAYFLWKILFDSEFICAIAANKEKQAREILKRIQAAYERLPMFLQQGIKEWNKGSIWLENESRVITAATSSSGLRGGTISALFLDEFAHIDSNLADDFFTSTYPVIMSGSQTKLIVCSTPKGMNHFYKMWTEADEGRSNFTPIRVEWNEVPGRDEAWRKQQIENITEERFLQEFECEFMGSSGTLIRSAKLRELAVMAPIRQSHGMDIWEEPFQGRAATEEEKKEGKADIPPGMYVAAVDVARGSNLDYSVVSVIRCDSFPYKVVAKYRNNTVSNFVLHKIVYDIARTYNDAYVIVETNDAGLGVVQALQWDLEYENCLFTTSEGRNGVSLCGPYKEKAKPGIYTSERTKRIGAQNMKALIEDQKLIINDYDLIRELSNFIAKGQSFQAVEGENDDIVMSILLFSYCTDQEYFKQLTETHARRQTLEMKTQQYMEELLPFGYVELDGMEILSQPGGSYIEDLDSDEFDKQFGPSSMNEAKNGFFW
jgi:hypothetical protein